MNDLLAQRKEIKRLEKERELTRHDKEENEEKLAEEARERELREFEMVSTGLEERKRKRDTENQEDERQGNNNANSDDVLRKRRKGFELDEEEMRRIAKEERDKIRKKIEKERVRIYSPSLHDPGSFFFTLEAEADNTHIRWRHQNLSYLRSGYRP